MQIDEHPPPRSARSKDRIFAAPQRSIMKPRTQPPAAPAVADPPGEYSPRHFAFRINSCGLVNSYSYSVQRYSYSYSMAVRTPTIPILDRAGHFCFGPMRWIELRVDDYEYRSSVRADSLSTSTKQSTNKSLHRSARSTCSDTASFSARIRSVCSIT
jgi:hypothetical protein